MTKKNSNHKGDEIVRVSSSKTREYISSKGAKATLHGVPPLEIPAIYDMVEYPEIPTYSVETASGEIQKFPHDETTLVTEEDKTAWEFYKTQMDLADNTLTDMMLNEILIEGVEIDLSDPMIEVWKRKQHLKKLPVPEDPDELALSYKKGMIACSGDDITALMDSVMELTGVDRSRLDAAKASFQSSMESQS